MSKKTSTSDVLLNIAKAIRENATINSLSKSNFGRPLNVIVGGYAQKLASEEAAPFVWVFSDEEESNINNEGICSFLVKIVLGVCPMKDIPSTSKMFEDSENLRSDVHGANGLYHSALVQVGEESEFYEAFSDLVDDATELMEEIDEHAQTALDKAASGDWNEMINSMSEMTLTASYLQGKNDSMLNLFPIGAIPPDLLNANRVQSYICLTLIPFVNRDIADIRTAFQQYEEDPYISKVYNVRTENDAGLVVYGAINMFDQFKDELYDIMNRGKFGMPFSSMKCKNQSVSHYPLDWNEFTIQFENVETLSL